MVPAFSRSISLPIGRGSKGRAAAARPSLHVRSVSLPSPSHPVLSHLESQICALRSCLSRPDLSPPWIAAALSQIDLLHAALDELLLLPDVRAPLRCAAVTTGRILDDLLLLADAYGSLRSLAVDLRHHHTELQAAIRRRDPARLASALRSQRRTEKEFASLAAAVAPAAKGAVLVGSNAVETEMVGIWREAIGATAAATVAIMSGAAAISAAASSATAKACKRIALKNSSKRTSNWEEEKEKLGKWEDCIGNLEGGSERVLRGLLNTRVSLLNTLTPPF